MRKKTHAEFVEDMKNFSFIPQAPYVNSSTKMPFLCVKCSCVAMMKPNTVLSGGGCDKCRSINNIIEDHGSWLIIDISTNSHPVATMAIDAGFWYSRTTAKIHANTNGHGKYIYAVYRNGGKIHRDVISAPDGVEVDHIKHGTLSFVDNRLSNLRLVTQRENALNKSKQKSNTSGATGVHLLEGMWTPRISINGKRKYLGRFSKIEDAIKERKRAEEKYYGEYAFEANNPKGGLS